MTKRIKHTFVQMNLHGLQNKTNALELVSWSICEIQICLYVQKNWKAIFIHHSKPFLKLSRIAGIATEHEKEDQGRYQASADTNGGGQTVVCKIALHKKM